MVSAYGFAGFLPTGILKYGEYLTLAPLVRGSHEDNLS